MLAFLLYDTLVCAHVDISVADLPSGDLLSIIMDVQVSFNQTMMQTLLSAHVFLLVFLHVFLGTLAPMMLTQAFCGAGLCWARPCPVDSHSSLTG
jgi:hypothetical protein